MLDNENMVNEMLKSINFQLVIVRLEPYKDDMESVKNSLSSFPSDPDSAWNIILKINKKYKNELSILYDYYPYSHIRIVPDVLITNALILSNLNKLQFILPRCMLLKEVKKAQCA